MLFRKWSDDYPRWRNTLGISTGLALILTTLILGAVAATVFATFFGWSTSRRLLRPLSRVADDAGQIADLVAGTRSSSQVNGALSVRRASPP